ncbi:MAG: GAF domain-containing protein, partial [Bryobacteraceae bacterium]
MVRQRGLPADAVIEALAAIARAPIEQDSPDALLETIYRECIRVIEADGFAAARYDPAEEALRFDPVYERGDRRSAVVENRKDRWGLVGRVLADRATLLFEDLSRSGAAEEAVPFSGNARSWLGAPLVFAGQPMGALIL